MASLLDILKKNQPTLQTHQALLVIGLQNDFLRPDGKLPIDTRSGFVQRIEGFIPRFREHAGDVIWVRTVFEDEWPVNDPSADGDTVLLEAIDGLDDDEDSSLEEMAAKDLIQPASSSRQRHKQRALDLFKRVSARKKIPARTTSPTPAEEDELFLSKSSKKGPCCAPNTLGAEFTDSVKSSIDKSTDLEVVTSHYSAFNGTMLLVTLRARLVTELYLCGCLTNISVFATALDAARHGFTINIIEDCLGFRKQMRHDEAIKKMVSLMGAYVLSSVDLAKDLSKAPELKKAEAPKNPNDTYDLQALVDKLKLNDDARPKSKGKTVSSKSSPDYEPQILRPIPRKSQGDEETKQNFVQTKIRMRSRSSKNKKKDDGKTKAEVPREAASSSKAPAEASPDRSSKKPAAPPEPPPRVPTIARAESSDMLKGKPPTREQKLKSHASQPALSSSSKDKDSKLRLSFGRSTKSAVPPLPSPKAPKALEKLPKTTEKPPIVITQPTMPKKLQSLATFPVLGPDDTIAEGDSRIIYDFFPPTLCHPKTSRKSLKDVVFTQLYNEVRWQKMYHAQGEVPRLVCVQGEFGSDGSMPVYRHPSDQSMPLLHFSPTVQLIREEVEKVVHHPVNHVLIQLYRSGQDYISEHSDKTLDIVRGSSIVSVSFGAQRTMRLRTKKSAKSEQASEDATSARNTQRIAMPHNSIFVLGQDSNMRWLHGITADKRSPADRSDVEKAFSGMRISLTFRRIGTFLDSDTRLVWGQGATAKDRSAANDVVNDDEEETEKIIHAFGKENHSTEFDWDGVYGEGFDVLHFRAPPVDNPILFASNDVVDNRQIAICLAELGLAHTVMDPPTIEKEYEGGRQICYRDADLKHSEVVGAIPILLYLDRYHHLDRDDYGKEVTANAYEIIQVVLKLQESFQKRASATFHEIFIETLEALEDHQARTGSQYIAGLRFSIADCAAWPVLDHIIENGDDWSRESFPALTTYYQTLWKKKKSVGRLRSKLLIK
ncbi:hypothetical protein BU16DRAFT_465092 [Lophium mytilinum]|uniref:Fe2OG dioxygenase domain-containing protein n=1 Tax=Lophium mytilinum TaxID=390894 RepID=A0A6A6QMH7_9PEZI|nr:hypothetical protein BU16DRAFT_465092 [Lophium mytilinum]